METLSNLGRLRMQVVRLKTALQQANDVTVHAQRELYDADARAERTQVALDRCRKQRALLEDQCDKRLACMRDQHEKLRFLLMWADERGLLEDGCFTWPDGDVWCVRETTNDEEME